MTMMTFSTDKPETCGILEVDSKGVVQKMFEKQRNPPGNLANAAVYILEPLVLKELELLKKEEIDFSTEIIPRYLGKIFTYHNSDYHRDIGSMESYEAAQSDFAPHKLKS
jgi:mannose-1-phosphate guanylyltransferase